MQGEDDSVIEPLAEASSAPTGSTEPADEIFLEGPRSRLAEFFTLLRVMRDFLRGFRTLHFVGPCVTVFGSARIRPNDPHYELARKMGAAIARLGFTVITGGGPGIMEAANRGAKQAGGRSVGCTIELPSEQPTNVYLDRCVRMHYFFARKTLLIKYSYAFVVMPGGAGTLDELFEALTLIQTGKIKNFPIVIMGTDYWKELLYFIDKMAQRGMIAAGDLSLIYATDSVDCSVSAACQGDCGLDAQPYKRERVIEVKPYLVTAARTRNTQPTIPKSKLTIQNRGFFVSAEIAAIAIAIWNMVTPRANTSCL